jgi:hypothetical protein
MAETEWHIPYGKGPPELAIYEREIGYWHWGEIDRWTLDPSIYEVTLRIWWDEELQTPERILYDGNIKTYPLGFRFRAEVGWRQLRGHEFLFWLTQTHNWLANVPEGAERQIRFWPHNDVPDHYYVVRLENPWDYDYAFRQRWIGFGGAVRFRGIKRVSRIPWYTVPVIQSSQGFGSNFGSQYFASSAGIVADGYDSFYDAYQIGVFYPDQYTAALYRMNHRHGNVLYDASPNRNDGSLVGPVRLSSLKDWQGNLLAGVDGDGLRFDGVDDRVSIPHHSSLSLFGASQDGTIEGYFRRDGAPASQQTLICKTDGNAGYVLRIKPTSGYAEIYLFDPTYSAIATGTTDICDNHWHHLRGEREAGAKVRIFVDETKEHEVNDTAAMNCANSAVLQIGRLAGGTECFGGDADEIRLSTALRSSFTN